MTRFETALAFATKAHIGATRKGSNAPYIEHPIEVAEIAKTMTDDEDVMIAALLHDTVEDTSVTIETIQELFGKHVASLVKSDTEDKRPDLPPEATWKIRKQETINYLNNEANIEEKILVVSDKLSNMRQLANNYKIIGDEVWNWFHQKDKDEHGWYYLSILDATQELQKYSAWQELYTLVHEIFDKQ